MSNIIMRSSNKLRKGITVLGIDIGTGSTKCVGFRFGKNNHLQQEEEKGMVCEPLFAHHATYESSPVETQDGFGFVEQKASVWMLAVMSCLRKAAASLEANPLLSDEDKVVSCVGISGAMQQLILVPGGENDRAILYSDTRASKEFNEMVSIDPSLPRIADNFSGPGAIPPKLLWLKRNRPEIYHQGAQIMLGSHSYVIWQLTNKSFTDWTTASTTGLLLSSENSRKEWIGANLLSKLGIGECSGKLPSLIMGDGQGRILDKFLVPIVGEQENLLPSNIFKDTIFMHASGDVGAVAMGAQFLRRGMNESLESFQENEFLYLGTSSVLCKTAPGSLNKSNEAFALDHPREPHSNILAFSMMCSGGNVIHMAENIFEIGNAPESLKQFDELASKSPSGSNRLLYLPYIYGERVPLASDSVRGGYLGLSLQHRKRDLYRAALEGVAYHIRWLAEVSGRNMKKPLFVCGGGAKSKLWLQIFADVLNCEIVASQSSNQIPIDVAALGSALWCVPNPDRFKEGTQHFITFKPNPEAVKMYENMYPIWRMATQDKSVILDIFEKLKSMP